jgi:hypothetical protein
MRGRKPRALTIAPSDEAVLRWIAKVQAVPLYQVLRAQMILAVASGERINVVAARLGCDEATIWRTCRRYEHAGLSGLLADGRIRPRTSLPQPTDRRI